MTQQYRVAAPPTKHAAAPPVAVPRLPQEFPPVSRLKQWGASVCALDRRPRPRPFLLYGQGRTGSNLLGGLLGSHPDITFGNEVLAALVRHPWRYVDGLRAHAGNISYGIHVKRYHLTDVQQVRSPRRWLEEARDRGWLLVHIQRQNTLRHVLSNFSLNATGVSHFLDGDGRTSTRLTLDPDQLLTWMEIRSRVRDLEHEDLHDLGHLTVTYERDLLPGRTAWSTTAPMIFSALELSDHPVNTELRKVNEGSLQDLLTNYEEVAAALRASRWSHLVES